VKRLLSFELREQLKNLERSIASQNALSIRYVPAISAEQLKKDLVAAIVDRAFFGEDELPRTPKAFEELKKRAKTRLPAVTEAVLRHAAAIADAWHEASRSIAASGALGRVT